MGSGIAQNTVGARPCADGARALERHQPIAALLAAGAYRSTPDVAKQAEVDVLILCVTGTPQVEAVMLGEKGALAALRPGTVVVDCSTARARPTSRVARLVRTKGGHFLDAPMTRTAKEAAEGCLNLLVGGDAEGAGLLPAAAARLRRERHARGRHRRRPC